MLSSESLRIENTTDNERHSEHIIGQMQLERHCIEMAKSYLNVAFKRLRTLSVTPERLGEKK